jgi:hypothetical protein
MLRNLLLLGIFTLFTVAAYIIFNLYHSATTTKVAESTSKIVTPLVPRFDSETLDKLKTREVVSVDLSERIATTTPTLASIFENIASVSPQLTSEEGTTSALVTP